jgi:NAD(P)-dependent dehydrogenase (short-subunit alcohol dehydrogenase family)
MQLGKKVVVITGAARGLGRAMALLFAGRGAEIAALDRDGEALADTVAQCEALGVRAKAFVVDVTSEPEVIRCFDEVTRHFGRFDVLVNNAGITRDALLVKAQAGEIQSKMTLAQWQAVVDVNLTGMFLCAQAAFRMMKEQDPRGGRIINNGSISAHVPRPGSAPYTATKHGVTGLTKTIALDGRGFEVVCGQIDIGNAISPMTERMAQGVRQANGTLAAEARMDASHVGDAVVFMANLPLDVNVHTMTIMASKMPFVGRG